MSLLNPTVEPAHKSRPMIIAIVAIVFLAGILLWYSFRYYPEKKAAERFFNALIADHTDLAYQLWQAGPSYKMKDFLADWGASGYYGPVRSYRIMKAHTLHNASGVLVEVAVSPYSPMPAPQDPEKSQKTRLVTVWIESKDKSFSFPP